jgi:cell division protein FtsW
VAAHRLLACAFGLAELYSASAFLARGRAARALLRRAAGGRGGHGGGGGAGGVADGLPALRRLAWPLLLATTLLLLLTVLPGTESIAPRINGARRWLDLGVSFQPSEFAKIACWCGRRCWR